MMDSCPTGNMVLADGCNPASPSSPSSCSASGPQSATAPVGISSPLAMQAPSQLGQCVYVLSPWRRARNVYSTGQPPPQNNPGLLRFTHPTPTQMGLLRVAPYRPYFPGVASRTPDAQDYGYDYYSAYVGGTADYGSFSASVRQDVQQPEKNTAQTSYESLYPTAYTSQMYPTFSPQQCWGTTPVAYSTPELADKSLAYYPDRVAKLGVPTEYVGEEGPSGSSSAGGNVTKKSVRVKFMGPETMYLTTKTLEMQPGRSSSGAGAGAASASSMAVLDTPGEAYENLRASDEGLHLNQVVAPTSTDDAQEHDDDQERVTFNSIEEALACIDPTALETDEASPQTGPPLQDKAFLQVSAVTYQGLRMADEKQEEVIKAAKSLFSKRTRTLYHWLYPQTSKNKLKATVSAAWDTLAEMEKQFYVSQVLGRFGLQASSLMINPQLDGIKGLPTEMLSSSSAVRPRLITLPSQEPGKLASTLEAQQAVDQLFASCADSESWTSYCGATSPSSASIHSPRTGTQTPTLTATALSSSPVLSVQSAQSSRQNKSRAGLFGNSPGQTDNRRKRTFSRMTETGGRARLGAVNDHLDEEVTILKRMREANLGAEFEGDPEVSDDLEKIHLMSQDSDRNPNSRDGDDFWRRTPDPEDLFTHLEF